MPSSTTALIGTSPRRSSEASSDGVSTCRPSLTASLSPADDPEPSRPLSALERLANTLQQVHINNVKAAGVEVDAARGHVIKLRSLMRTQKLVALGGQSGNVKDAKAALEEIKPVLAKAELELVAFENKFEEAVASANEAMAKANDAERSKGPAAGESVPRDVNGGAGLFRVHFNPALNRSSLCSSLNGIKVGAATFPYFMFDPTEGATLSARLVPEPETTGSCPESVLHGLIPLRPYLQSTPETQSSNSPSDRLPDYPSWQSVEDAFKNLVDPVYQTDAVDVSRLYRRPLKELQLPVLAATADSVLDCVTVITRGTRIVPLSVVELKASHFDVVQGLDQAAEAATCVAAGLVLRGVPWKAITVSFMVCNGHTILFGGVHLVGPLLPMPYVTSSALSLLDYHDAHVAHLHMTRHKLNTERLAQEVRAVVALTSTPVADALEFQMWVPDTVFCKPNVIRVESQSRRGTNDSTWEASVCALFTVYNRLYWGGARDVVAFPYGVINGLRDAADESVLSNDRALLLPDLRKQDPPFQLSPPEDFAMAWAFVDAVEAAVTKIHRTHTVHGDLYQSNIFHRVVDGALQIKFIDFDTSFSSNAAAPPVGFDMRSRLLYDLCKNAQDLGVMEKDIPTLNCTLDWTQVYAMRHCLVSLDGFSKWQEAARTSSVVDLVQFSRTIERDYLKTLENLTYSEAMDAVARTKAQGAARASGASARAQ